MKVAVVGASGYLGAELLRLLSGHPEFEVAVAQAESSAGRRPGELYAGLGAGYTDLVLEPIDAAQAIGCDVAFVAVPSGHSQAIVAALAGKVGLVVDLGADFRLKDPAAYEQWYHFTHTEPELLASAVFGLPELFRDDRSRVRKRIASPGCYVTAASLALAPLVAAGGDPRTTGIIIDAASGTLRRRQRAQAPSCTLPRSTRASPHMVCSIIGTLPRSSRRSVLRCCSRPTWRP